MIYNIVLEPVYIPSEDNVLADLLSRICYPEYAKKMILFLNDNDICCKDRLVNACRSITGSFEEESPAA